MHTVEVRAYLDDGTLLTAFTRQIDVKMMPEITANYVLPDGSVGTIVETANNTTGVYLANRPNIFTKKACD